MERTVNVTGTGRLAAFLFLLTIAGVLAGCPKATVTPTYRTAGPLPRPDMIVVCDLAVNQAEVKLDQGVMQKAMRDSSSRAISDEEAAVGHVVANKLSEVLVQELRDAGIAATRAGSQVRVSSTTAILTGQFITIDQGSQTARVWIGFGLGGTELRTRIQVIQGGMLVAEGETATRSSLKPGMLASGGLAAGASTVTPLIVGGSMTVINESYRGTVEADASRTAKEIAKRVKAAYQERGWLP